MITALLIIFILVYIGFDTVVTGIGKCLFGIKELFKDNK